MHCLQAARNGIYQTKERAENERQSRLLNSLLACGPSISAEHQARDLFSGLKREIWGVSAKSQGLHQGPRWSQPPDPQPLLPLPSPLTY